jgi:hypothetical protein
VSPARTSAEKAAAAQAASLRELCNERLSLVQEYESQPENRDAIGAVLEENRLAQKMARRSPAVIARSNRTAKAAAAAAKN